ncbi:MAG: hypothetical protein H0U82_03550 [Actinobacteria bacterium]|nr:hypothetical protein [Actinomycetota bacterium]
MRIALARAALPAGLVVAAALIVALFPAAGQSGPPPPKLVGSSQYVVRPDPRLCPSPICGGYWVALANRSRTRCADGAVRPRCYVALAVDEKRQPLQTGMSDGTLVRADIDPWTFQGFGNLGALVVADVRAPIGRGTKGTYFKVRDLGIRCIRAPCFSLGAAKLNRPVKVTVSSLDLTLATRLPKEWKRAEKELTAAGLFLLGRVVKTSDAGWILQASRIYLPVTAPRG